MQDSDAFTMLTESLLGDEGFETASPAALSLLNLLMGMTEIAVRCIVQLVAENQIYEEPADFLRLLAIDLATVEPDEGT